MAKLLHITTATLRAIAVEASADPRSVRRVLLGEYVRGMADDRIRAALLQRGIVPPTLESSERRAA